jgi:REP element-mobilizing transposase RayT
MPRVPRSLLPDGYFHVTTRGVAKSAIYRDDADRRFFLRLILLTRKRYDWSFYALCLMDNHYHLVVDTPRERLSLGMQELNGTYAQAFNRKYRRWGHLFGDRFASRVVRDEQHLINVCAYVVQNPVRAGLCDRAVEWPWSHSRFELEDLD